MMLFIIDNKQRRFMDINALWLKETQHHYERRTEIAIIGPYDHDKSTEVSRKLRNLNYMEWIIT